MLASRARRGGIHDIAIFAEFRQKFKNLVIDRHKYANNLVPVPGLDGVVPCQEQPLSLLGCYMHIISTVQ